MRCSVMVCTTAQVVHSRCGAERLLGCHSSMWLSRLPTCVTPAWRLWAAVDACGRLSSGHLAVTCGCLWWPVVASQPTTGRTSPGSPGDRPTPCSSVVHEAPVHGSRHWRIRGGLVTFLSPTHSLSPCQSFLFYFLFFIFSFYFSIMDSFLDDGSL